MINTSTNIEAQVSVNKRREILEFWVNILLSEVETISKTAPIIANNM
jgi:hypothetical protein